MTLTQLPIRTLFDSAFSLPRTVVHSLVEGDSGTEGWRSGDPVDAGLIPIDLLGRSSVLWGYGLMGMLAFAFVFFFVPETKGKSLEEIEASWR